MFKQTPLIITQEELQSQLFKAIQDEDEERIKKWVQEGASLTQLNPDLNLSPLDLILALQIDISSLNLFSRTNENFSDSTLANCTTTSTATEIELQTFANLDRFLNAENFFDSEPANCTTTSTTTDIELQTFADHLEALAKNKQKIPEEKISLSIAAKKARYPWGLFPAEESFSEKNSSIKPHSSEEYASSSESEEEEYLEYRKYK